MPNASHTIREELYGILLFIGSIWGVFVVTCVFPSLDDYGVVPRTLVGLVGIVAGPFLHADWRHLLGNTIPLFVLLALLAGSKARSWEIVAAVAVLGGAFLWIFGRQANHIGVSGLIFGLGVFLIASGILERRLVPMAVAAVVGFLYGGTLLFGVLPHLNSRVSWDGHLCGAVAGGITAYVLVQKPTRQAGQKGTEEVVGESGL
jgi:membrane associated rhomboid family serine protease